MAEQAAEPLTLENCCIHCGLLIPLSFSQSRPEGTEFCCAGCECVYHLIQEMGLQHFYEIKEKLPPEAALPAAPSSDSFSHFDDREFQARYTTGSDAENLRIELLLEGIHCAACVWLLEKLPEVVSGVVDARVSFEDNALSLVFDPRESSLSRIAATLASLGYKPHPKTQESVQVVNRRLRRDLLIRLAVAGMCAGNTMRSSPQKACACSRCGVRLARVTVSMSKYTPPSRWSSAARTMFALAAGWDSS